MKNKKNNSYTNSSTVFIQLLALAVIVMIFVMFIAKQTQRVAVVPSPTPINDVQGANFTKQGSSDEITEIEADLKATDFTKLDSGISDIDSDLSAE